MLRLCASHNLYTQTREGKRVKTKPTGICIAVPLTPQDLRELPLLTPPTVHTSKLTHSKYPTSVQHSYLGLCGKHNLLHGTVCIG